MGNSVGGLRDSFYRELRREYQREGENALLYRYFWTEAVTELLEAHQLSADCPIQPENGGRIKARLREAVEARQDLLLRPAAEQDGRRDFWMELWLNDAGYQAKLISDRDYYLWLVEYLAAHDLYYRDTGLWDGRRWLIRLLREGWLGAGEPRDPGLWRQKSGKTVFSTAQIRDDLRELAERLRTDREKIAGRLHDLEEEGEDYLPWLTDRLERMALHIKIKNWLQNSGYPLGKNGDGAAKPSAKAAQKQDLSLRLLEAYCASGRGGDLLGQGRNGEGIAGGWRLTDDGFCLPDGDEVEALREALERSGETCFYIPLAVDLRSGCVLFLAGRDIYERGYEEEEKRWRQYHRRMEEEYRRARETYAYAKGTREHIADRQALKEVCERRRSACRRAERGCKRAEAARAQYEASPARLCFDYLRLDREHLRRHGEDPAGAFRLRPVFHRQAEEEGYQAVLAKFMAYCRGECDRSPGEAIPREAIREFDQEAPAGIPETFRWAFEARSRESEDAFGQSRRRPLGSPSTPLPGSRP